VIRLQRYSVSKRSAASVLADIPVDTVILVS